MALSLIGGGLAVAFHVNTFADAFGNKAEMAMPWPMLLLTLAGGLAVARWRGWRGVLGAAAVALPCPAVSIAEPPVRSTSERGRTCWPRGPSRRRDAEDRGGADGVVEASETWTGPYFSPEIGQVVGSIMAAGDTMLLGRVTYETFAASFAGNTSEPMAAQMNALPKVVVSATMEQAGWENSTLIGRDVAREITRLKEQPGGNINVSGSGTLVAWLLGQGLLDELNLLLFPVVVGHGKRLFGEGSTTALTLARSEAFSTGVVQLVYHAAGNA